MSAATGKAHRTRPQRSTFGRDKVINHRCGERERVMPNSGGMSRPRPSGQLAGNGGPGRVTRALCEVKASQTRPPTGFHQWSDSDAALVGHDREVCLILSHPPTVARGSDSPR
ncbi:MAG: hypothetical protein B5766_07925 [Candidatus Lumbricidophila eiseniae]|uniref:Uncharacterized protein n=1 Tax=Candidatus Lumbricidiphila eiseniae TaxID=1969409 RepID=A0A2A6FQ98_9MICO|nr:MAG: hypothetical protein B5766_07925 [Candidatus Lumbricidophila eiseniae]